MLVLNEQDQQQLLNMEEVVEEVAQSLRAFSEGKQKHHCAMSYHSIMKIDI